MSVNSVIVSGAGPVGLTFALIVARAGLPVTLLEKRQDVNTQSKASTFHAPTLDLLASVGVLPQMIDDGAIVEGMQFRGQDDQILARMEFASLASLTEHPFRLHYEQTKLSAMLRDLLLKEEGARIEFGCEVASTKETPEGVQVVTRGKGGETVYSADIVVGCDGAQSAVREAAKIGYIEKPYPGMVLRLYAHCDLNKFLPGLDGITYVFNGDDSVSLLEMNDCWRIVVRVPEDVSESEAVTDEWIAKRLKHLIPIEEILPYAGDRDVYAARRRETLKARTERVFLAGDALHLTNTRGGMNLNAGLHDAFALAHAAIESAANGQLAPLHRAADERKRITSDLLIPRTDENVGTGSERVKSIVDIAQSKDKSVDYLAKQAMLDMLSGVSLPKHAGALDNG